VRARDLNHPSGLFIPNGRAFYSEERVADNPVDAGHRLRFHCLFPPTLLDYCSLSSSKLSRPLRLANCLPTLPQPTVEA
jgi:hypothetical protein